MLLTLAVSSNVALRIPIATKEQVSSQHSLAHPSYIYSGAGYPRGDSQSQKGTVEHITVRQAIRDVAGSQGLINPQFRFHLADSLQCSPYLSLLWHLSTDLLSVEETL